MHPLETLYSSYSPTEVNGCRQKHGVDVKFASKLGFRPPVSIHTQAIDQFKHCNWGSLCTLSLQAGKMEILFQYAIPKINMLRNLMLFENEVKAAVQ